jgi:bifunctional ADP-heptose synthase (sugar kinase/adenylyltransferase)
MTITVGILPSDDAAQPTIGLRPAPTFRVYTDIVGDLFHGGHVSFLERVREAATAIAGAQSDEWDRSANRAGGGPHER